MKGLRRIHAFAMRQLARNGGLQVFRVFHRRLDGGQASAAVLPGLEIRPLSQTEVLGHCKASLDLSEQAVRAAFGRGGVCVGALKGEALAGYAWFALDRAPHVNGVWVEVPSQAVYRYKAFVHPAYRGRGVAPALYRFADRLFAGSGREYVVNCIATHNFSSIAASKSSGAMTLGFLGYWQRGRRFVAFHSPAVQRFGLRFYLS